MSSIADSFTKEGARNASLFDWRNFDNESITRQFKDIAEQGTSAMNDTKKLERVSAINTVNVINAGTPSIIAVIINSSEPKAQKVSLWDWTRARVRACVR